MKVGVLGGGQLGRMLALAGARLGLSFEFYDTAPDVCAAELGRVTAGRYEDRAKLRRFARHLDVATYEFENVPVEAGRTLAGLVPFYPPPVALEVSQDRLVEKQFFQSLGIAVAPFVKVDSLEDLDTGVKLLGLPSILKTRRHGYDGKGQAVLRRESDLRAAWKQFRGIPCVLEAFVPFDREVSVIAVRGRKGEIVFYPLVENHHREGILHLSLAPAPDVSASLEAQARSLAGSVLKTLKYTGTLVVECFQVRGRLLANEMATRVHNSGHWTIDGAETSQFENHLRAILGWPLGSTKPLGHSAMINLVGAIPETKKVLAIAGARLHLYGKEPRPGRKVGHVTVTAADAEARNALAARVEQIARSVRPALRTKKSSRKD